MSEPPYPRPLPQAPPTPAQQYRSSAEWAVVAVIAACTVTAVELAQAVTVFSARDEYVRASRNRIDPADVLTAYHGFALFSLLALLFAYPATCLWLQRVRRNAEALRPEHPHGLGRGWIWGGWVCPVVNFWFPYQVLRDIRRATASTTSADALLGVWWAAWLVAAILENVAGYLLPSSGDQVRPAVDWLLGVEVVGGVVWAMALAAWLVIIRDVQRAQSQAAAEQSAVSPTTWALPEGTAWPYVETRSRWHGGAIAALVGAIAAVLVGVGAVALLLTGQFGTPAASGGLKDERADGSASSSERLGDVGASSLAVGDCLPEEVGEGELVETVPLVPCSAPHRYEVYAVFKLPGRAFPGERQVQRLGDGGCFRRFRDFVGRPYSRSRLEYMFIYPQEGNWTAENKITCLVFDTRDTTGTLRGSRH